MPVEAKVLQGWVQPDGTRISALHLALAPGWKTYWRTPGDAGIPPQFDWTGSRNVRTVDVVWPTPKVFDQNGMRSVGYENQLIIPLQIDPRDSGAPVTLSLDMELGICSDICIPHSISLDARLDGPNSEPTPAIAAALAEQPYSAREASVRAAQCALAPTPDGMQIDVEVQMPSAGKPEHIVIEPGAPDIWVSEPKTTRRGDSVTASAEMVHVSGGTIALDRSAVRITVLGSKYAVDIRGCTAG